ncbi:rhodanese-like domain-containing protein [Aestuariicoccus sp. MJ-SS9]|uniref:rhodanese-like domain-containing protein n=1 Tax=Aestuariicoccus sp. MJ-SS9 TaxID=3079855 RepID=UPI00290AB029|nr:rhodanese-like domain-containing protein [Aestuariicoccus sp. MJ-SS9]MDU8910705.1 rhodanese-like domain-containing protein [Aestuariicoccus sp. MJ-SS9]
MKTETIGDAVLETWDAEDVAAAFARDEIYLVDVRTPQEYMFEHIEGALLMPMAFFCADKLPGQTEKQLVLYCGSGVRSDKMARKAIEAGVKRVAHLAGGFGAWKAAKKPFIGTNMGTGAPQRVG